jgi:hypothetical protein
MAIVFKGGTAYREPKEVTTIKEMVALREVEYCGECGKSFLSLYPIDKCTVHAKLEQI